MKRNSAVIDRDASAASDVLNDSHSVVMPDDENYRRTGQLEPETPPKKDDAEKKGAVTPGEGEDDTDGKQESVDSDTAAASEAASGQEKKGPERSKFPSSGKNRLRDLSQENKRLREQLARQGATTTTTQPQPVTPPQTTQPKTEAAEPEPKIDDVDPKTGKAKYPSWAEWNAAVRAWDRKQAVAEFQKLSSTQTREQQQQQAEQLIERTIAERTSKFIETAPDYPEAIAELSAKKDRYGQDELFFRKGDHLDGYFLDNDNGPAMYYHLAKNWDACKYIFARDQNGKFLLNPVRQIRELTKLESKLGARSAGSGGASSSNGDAGNKPIPSAKPITKAPRPVSQTSGQGSVREDATEQAVKEGDFESYRDAENARALARRAKNG